MRLVDRAVKLRIGVSIVMLSPLWPYPMSFNITLDSNAPEAVSVYDTSVNPPIQDGDPTKFSGPVWKKGGLANISHTLVVNNGNKQGGFHDIHIDAFKFVLVFSTVMELIHGA